MNPNKVAIIGAGPAGIACAIQLSRYGIIPLLFERNLPGGLLKNANLVENYPGFPGGISGISLAGKMAKQLELAKVPVINELVLNITYENGAYQIGTNREEYSAEIVVIASGTIPVEWNDPGLFDGLPGKVFYEVYPLREIRDATVAIIGAGDAAFDYALQMALYNKVIIFNRSDRVRCLPLLWQRAKCVEQISYYENYLLTSVKADPSTSCLKLLFQTKNEIESRYADYIIFAVGRKPELSFADPGFLTQIERLKQERKLYLVGDVKNDLLRQASISAGDGIRAAMEIYLNESH